MDRKYICRKYVHFYRLSFPKRVRRFVAIALCAVAFLQAADSSAQDADSAKTFLVSVYQHYQNDGAGIETVGPQAGLFFYSTLLALMRADEKAASPDIGAIDADPVCACQDWDGIWDLQIDVHQQTPERAKAGVSFALTAPKGRSSDALRKLLVTLAAEDGAWRIYDIVDLTDPTHPFALRRALEQDIASHQHPDAARPR